MQTMLIISICANVLALILVIYVAIVVLFGNGAAELREYYRRRNHRRM